MDPKEERDLVDRAKKDSEAFDALFNHFYPKILNYTFRRTGDLEVAEDLTSEAFLRAFNKLWQFKFRSLPFSSWLYRIANNLVNDYYRRGQKWLSLESMTESGVQVEDKVDVMKELMEQQEQAQKHTQFTEIQTALKTLPQKYQEVMALRYFEQKKVGEVAEILGKREGTVKSLLSRGSELLRQRLEVKKNRTQPISAPGVVTGENN